MGHLSVGRYYPVRIEPGDSPGLVTNTVFFRFFHIMGVQTTYQGPRTLSKTTDANLDFVFLAKTFLTTILIFFI